MARLQNGFTALLQCTFSLKVIGDELSRFPKSKYPLVVLIYDRTWSAARLSKWPFFGAVQGHLVSRTLFTNSLCIRIRRSHLIANARAHRLPYSNYNGYEVHKWINIPRVTFISPIWQIGLMWNWQKDNFNMVIQCKYSKCCHYYHDFIPIWRKKFIVRSIIDSIWRL